ncbi:MAG: hypothetical protein J5J06_05550 [Phycisphaerae bacterium]|nr:hypothetical protein [Phycisphaerae bacterium]
MNVHPTTTEMIEHNFTHHVPVNEAVCRLHADVRKACRKAALDIAFLCPESRERSLALTKLEEAMMWANAAIARNQE